MSSLHIAELALETWRASGARTESRLRALVYQFGASYYGPSHQWGADISEMVRSSAELALSRVQPWERLVTD